MEIPTTQQLREEFPLSLEGELRVLNKAREISEALNSPYENTVALVGPCAMTNHPVELSLEGERIAELNDERLVTVQRMPIWKPRSDSKDWKGLETNFVDIRDGKGYDVPGTEAQGLRAAYNILVNAASQNGGACIELKNASHIDRYDSLLSLGWSGSRSVDNDEQQLLVAVRDPKLPYPIKNGMDGSIDTALEAIELINQTRKELIDDPAPAVLIFRGGDKIRTPEEWERACIEAIHRTNGKVIIDVAHGSEMAHHPEGAFEKSVEGQIAAMNAAIRIAQKGHIAVGLMIEASDLESPTDPVMPLQTALDGVKRFHEAKVHQRKGVNV